MSLISVAFAAFFAVTLLLYYVLPRKWQWCLLLAAGIAFYLYSGPKYIIWLAVTVCATYFAGIMTGRSADRFAASAPELKKTLSKEEYKSESKKAERRRRIWLYFALTVDFGLLCLLKYLDFIVGNAAALFGHQFDGFGLVVPLGLSYYTFASVGYIVDVSRGKYKPEYNFAKFALYVSFFPQMIQGPIPRFEKLSPQLCSEHRFELGNLLEGLRLMLWGVFKVLVISAPLGPVVSLMTKNWQSMTGSEIWLGMFAWGIQLYTNFSGGIDIVSGVSRCFGITLEENFKRPYFATDLTDYWNRWHISLSNWLRDYLFYPIALSKKYARFTKFLKTKFGKFISRTVPVGLLSLLLFTVVGIWHGANWGEILFGVFNGVIILVSTLMEPLFEKIRKPLAMDHSFLWRVFRMIRTFILITLCRVISRAADITAGWQWYLRMFSSFRAGSVLSEGNGISTVSLLPAAAGCLILFLVSLWEERSKTKNVAQLIGEKPAWIRVTAEAVILVVIVVFGTYGLGYSAADFIYQQY